MRCFNCTVSLQLGEQLAQLVPASGVDVVELEDEGTCVRFSPLMTSAGNIHLFQPLVKTTICYRIVEQSPGVKADRLKKLFSIFSCGEDFLIKAEIVLFCLSLCCALAMGALVLAQLLWVTLPRYLCRKRLLLIVFKFIRKSKGKNSLFLSVIKEI